MIVGSAPRPALRYSEAVPSTDVSKPAPGLRNAAAARLTSCELSTAVRRLSCLPNVC
jgi:hypothetical protein